MSALWTRLRAAAPWFLAAAVLVLVAERARHLDWPAVGRALLAQPSQGLAAAAALALLSVALAASYDLIGRRTTAHGLSPARTLRIAATSYVFNLNFGALVGALGMRLRLYQRAGLRVGIISRVIALSVLTNWLGYLWVAGAALFVAPPAMVAGWLLGPVVTVLPGMAMWAVALTYVVLCVGRKRRLITLRGLTLAMPSVRVALWQSAVAAANWGLMGAIVWLLLQMRVDYPSVLLVLLVAAVAGVVTHVPAGLGVLEAVFLTMLGNRVPEADLLAALLAYRATYYLMPLALVLPPYLWSEAVRGRTLTSKTGRTR